MAKFAGDLCDEGEVDFCNEGDFKYFVIPAKAGTQSCPRIRNTMDYASASAGVTKFRSFQLKKR